MKKKTIIYTIVLFICYNVFLYYWEPEYISAQNFGQDNQIVAQEFLYTDKYNDTDNFIVGSSMSFRLLNDSLPGFCNLGLLGEGYAKGLQLIERKKIYPRRIFIEMNLLSTREYGGHFFDVLDNPFQAPFRKALPALRDGKQPTLLFGSYIEKKLVDLRFTDEQDKDKYLGIFRSFITPTPGVGVYAAFDKEASKNELDKAFNDLDYFIEMFEKNGTEIIFFQMPYYKSLQESPRFKSIISGFESKYPPSQYTYLPYPEYGEYETLDGSHLGLRESEKYTRAFKMAADTLKASQSAVVRIE